jgi:hypothetical protein
MANNKSSGCGCIILFVAVGFVIMFWWGRVGEQIGGGIIIPKVHVTFRNALLSNSLVAKIRNIDDKPLTNVRVSTNKWQEKYNVAAVLHRDDMVEAGWMELKEGLKEGMILYVYADTYAAPATVMVRLPK